MKLKTLPFVLLAFTAVIAAACTAPVDDDSNAEADEEIATAESALVNCGTTCPANEHPISYQICSNGCAPPACSAGVYNAVLCGPNSGTFGQCGTECPTGWHSTSLVCRTACGPCDPSTPNAANCAPD